MSAPLPPDVTIRPLRGADDPVVAALIRDMMTEHGCAGPGFAIHDAEVDGMSLAYAGLRAAYRVVERGGAVLGGGGIAPLAGGPPDVCELKKMYFRPALRGLGAGAALLGQLLALARRLGYRRCYLETRATMQAARALYERHGFLPLAAPEGATGHFGCDAWYALDL